MSISSRNIGYGNVDLRQAVKNLDSLPAMPFIQHRPSYAENLNCVAKCITP